MAALGAQKLDGSLFEPADFFVRAREPERSNPASLWRKICRAFDRMKT